MASKSAEDENIIRNGSKGTNRGITFDNFLQYLGMYLGSQLGLGQVEQAGSGGHLYWENSGILSGAGQDFLQCNSLVVTAGQMDTTQLT